MNGGEMMVVLIVAIVMVARVIHVRGGGRDFWESRRRFWSHRNRDGRGRYGSDSRSHGDDQDDAENRRLREEIRALKDRIAVLERIATDSSTHLDREIEALRDRPSPERSTETRDRPDSRERL